ncbi:50S ribosomal protein L17 [Tepidiforma bonchosmolovskayae]|uniref:Large ribosomal subunit protein bL17 n=1 Tax=Tepidiforma bonchosmolovskayae TaxID=2601677 RepID=A0ABX6C2M2_9CHLR|nr:50S ribosomal protein L17 [Tepidiforma bonchosmolovskayae]QFG03530.1 50S ribosomal protein L17 [Tepidiforma bonchosmolovskayae]
MRHRVAGRHLGRETSHRMALYRNLVTDLLRYEKITTTEAKAKEIRPMAERIITLGRRGDLHARRQALRFLYDPKVVKKVFDDIGPRMKDRPGGYLRITALEPRKGDGARMATIELVDIAGAVAMPRPNRVTAPPSQRRTPTPGAAAAAAAAAEIEAARAAETEAAEAAAEEASEAAAEPEASAETAAEPAEESAEGGEAAGEEKND